MEKWIVITGAYGFIGSHVVEKINKMGFKTVGLVRESMDGVVAPAINSACNALIPLSSLSAFMRGKKLEAVIHLATEYGLNSALPSILESNVSMPIKLIQLSFELGCTLFISADTFYGKPKFGYQHMKPYIYSKNDFVGWARLYCEAEKEMRIINLRLEHVYGPYDRPNKFIPTLINQLLANQAIVKLTPGNQLRDFIYVEDVANLFASILSQNNMVPAGFTEYEVGTGGYTSVREAVILLHSLISSKSKLEFGALPHRETEIMKSRGDPTTLRIYGWAPSISIRQGFMLTLEKIH